MRQVWLNKKQNKIVFSNKVNSFSIRDFCSAVHAFHKLESDKLSIDFSRVVNPYPNGMVPIIATIDSLKSKGISVDTILPNKYDIRKLFRKVNWAHMLSPEKFDPTESQHDRHLIIRNYDNPNDQKKVVDDFMDIVLRSMEIDRNVVSGIEWSINEITDNVLNHSNSKLGGYVQASTYPKNNTIAFAVADSGVGILSTLKEGIPTLRTDLQAIGEAMKEGVTRNKEKGQGNGLAGTLKVTSLTGGSFEVTSGSGRILSTQEGTKRNKRYNDQFYQGTIVCGQIRTDKEFSMLDVLDFGQEQVFPRVDFIETQYEADDEDCFIIKMNEETTGFGTRYSGRQLRTKTLNLLSAEQKYPVIIDWEGIPLISSSFADEFLGKLFLKLGAMTFTSRVRNKNMEELIIRLIDKAVSQRLTQEKDEE